MSDTDDPNTRTAKPKKAVKPRRLIDPKDPKKRGHVSQADRDANPTLSQQGGKGVKRMDLTKKEKDFLKDFFYTKSGYAGRDVLYKQLQAHYAQHKTPEKQRISRRRMWEFFLQKQEVNQLHFPARKTSIAIKPIAANNKLDKAQFDLVIIGQEPLRKYKGIAVLIDVATRRLWTEVLTSTKAKDVAKAMESILEEERKDLAKAVEGILDSESRTILVEDLILD